VDGIMVTARRELLRGAFVFALLALSCERGTYRDLLPPHEAPDADSSDAAADRADAPGDATDARDGHDASSEDGAATDGAVESARDAAPEAPVSADAHDASKADVDLEAASDASVESGAPEAATFGANSDATTDAILGPVCPIRMTDVTTMFGERVTGRVVASAGVNPYTKLMTERIGARTTRDHLVMFERVAGSWNKTDISGGASEHPRTDGDLCILATAADVGNFGETNNGSDTLIQQWTAVSPAAELLLFLQFNGDPWNDCLSISHNARQLVRSLPETLTDGGMAVIGPDHEALVFRWGGFPWNGGDDWQVRARLGSGFVGGFTAWKFDGMHAFAGVHEDGTLSVFRSTVLDVWKEDASPPAGPRIVGVPLAWTSLRSENLAATSDQQHLVVFSREATGDWRATDVTALDGETAIGRPARYELPNAFATEEVLIARNVAGHLVYHHRDRNSHWSAVDLSRASTIDTPVLGDPAAWGTPVQAAAAQGADGRLLVFEGLECLR
jgi:hypothetical protein